MYFNEFFQVLPSVCSCLHLYYFFHHYQTTQFFIYLKKVYWNRTTFSVVLVSVSWYKSSPSQKTFVSSAYKINFSTAFTLHKSFMNKINNLGPNTYPNVQKSGNKHLFSQTVSFYLNSLDPVQNCPLMPYHSSLLNMLWSIISNAFFKSMKITTTFFFPINCSCGFFSEINKGQRCWPIRSKSIFVVCYYLMFLKESI